jgi:hypothetical protein
MLWTKVVRCALSSSKSYFYRYMHTNIVPYHFHFATVPLSITLALTSIVFKA